MLLLSPLLVAAVTVPNVELPLTSPFEEQQQNAPVEQSPSIQDFQLQDIKSEDLDLEWLPAIQGPTPYSKEQLQQILSSCQREEPLETLEACAKTLRKHLLDDGFINSRVFSKQPEEQKRRFWQIRKSNQESNGILEVVLGQIVELQVESNDDALTTTI